MITNLPTSRYPRIYLAGPWVRRADVREARNVFQQSGIAVGSRWIDFDAEGQDEHNASTQQREALNDWEDIHAADALVLLNLEKSEGKAVETGMALVRGIPVIVIGQRSNVFHYLPQVTIVETIGDAIAKLQDGITVD